MRQISLCSAIAAVCCAVLGWLGSEAHAFTRSEQVAFQNSIHDFRSRINPRFKKIRRKQTRYIIVHTSEGGLHNTLKVVLDGKRHRGRRRTHGGHTHYVIARDGQTYRILDKKYRADHAGMSMWDGQKDVSSSSIGIELVGYHHSKITNEQYRSLGLLLEILQRIYRLDDRDVLTHSQVAYGRPNRWFKGPHRGRKRCAKNFDRARAFLGPTLEYDPDVKAGRLMADPELAVVFYSNRRGSAAGQPSNSITASNTAWMIAGEDYDSSETLYRLPKGRVVPGDELGRLVGWGRIPAGTEVLLNQTELAQQPVDLPVSVIEDGSTAWSIAGMDYKEQTTFYFFPNGHMKTGPEISDWDGLPPQTRMLVGYHGPFQVTSSRPPISIAGERYKSKDTLYYFPDRTFVSGSDIKDFKRLPRGVRIFLPSGEWASNFSARRSSR